jgi:hypothetical protein
LARSATTLRDLGAYAMRSMDSMIDP